MITPLHQREVYFFMNNLTTRKIVFGMLMVLVLAFSVQGIAEAADLPLSKTSGDLQTKSEGETFKITFSVGIRSNTTAIRNSDRKLIDDNTTILITPGSATLSTTPPGTRIDNNGYLIAEINSKDYRLTTPINADPSGLGEIPPSPTGYDRPYTVYEKRPSPFSDYVAYSGVIFANSSRSAFSNRGYPLYYHIPAENLNPGDGEDEDNDTSDTGERARTTSQIKIQTGDFYLRRNAANRYHYNEESITITVDKDFSGTFENTAMTFKLDAPGHQRDIMGITEVPGSAPDALPRSVTLICTPTDEGDEDDTTGIYTVRIEDVTRVEDTPWTTIPGGTRAYIEFTLYVVEETPATNYGVLVDGTTQYLRVDTAKEIERVSSRFNVVDAEASNAIKTETDLEIRYKVVKGSGTLYAAVSQTETAYVGPNQDLTVHQKSKVFLNTNGTDNEVSASIAGQDRKTFGATIVYEYSGSTTPARPPARPPVVPPVTPPVVPPPSLSADISGAPGSQQTLSVSTNAAAQVRVGQSGDSFLTAGGRVLQSSFAGSRAVTIILPNTVSTYNLTVTATTTGGTSTRNYRIRVVEADNGAQPGSQPGAQPGTGGTVSIGIQPSSGGPGTTATVTVTATPAASVAVTLRITAGGGTFANGTTTTTVTTGTNGTTAATLTRGSAPGSNYYITVSLPTGYTFRGPSSGERVIISGAPPSTGGTPTTAGPAADLDAYDGDQQSGTLNSPLTDSLVVEVVDANDNPVEDVRVRFRTTIGSGRFSPRTPRTDEDGFAETTFTPTSAGRIRISASVAGVDDSATFIVQGGEPADALEKVSGDTQSGTPGNALANPFIVEVQDEDGEPIAGHTVTFTVTAGGGSLSETSAAANANGRAQTTLTLGSERGVNSVRASVSGVDPVTFSTSIEPKILVAAANRPAMYWIDNGMLYGLAGAKAAKIAEGANGVAVGGGKLYWTEMTGESGGTINSANLDGDPDVTELASIFATPVGIAVDTDGSKLYWTNASGRIQSANLDGSRIQNVLQNLSNPTDIVVSNGFIYWTEGGNSVRRVNISGQKIAIDVAVNLDSVGGLAVGSGKVYWTEQTSATAGTVNGANLNGTNFEALATLLSAPMGISVDTAGSKLYWTNARGRVQSANLDGSGIKNVVEGLISASKIAIGGANTETTTVKAATPAKKDNAKYDVNGDGKVDNVDASLVASGLDTGNAKYDVNGDGTVNFLDLLLVFDNRDDDAAAAPAIVGMKLNAVQIDRIEEQIDLLLATNDRSPAAMRTLVYLQQLLATARPEKTQLFANYPNPFNPETWIPYELATDTNVTITIYNTQGVVIRTLQFGHQSAGYYTERDRAAYWDGRNALGEQVASGLYFYQLETDAMSSMRKMVILK